MGGAGGRGLCLAVQDGMGTCGRSLHDAEIQKRAQNKGGQLREKREQRAPFILGTLLDIGIGKRPVECINAILEGKEKPSASCDTKGLILYDIVY